MIELNQIDDNIIATKEIARNPEELVETICVNKHQLLRYLTCEIGNNQIDLQNPMVERYCNGEMWTYIHKNTLSLQAAFEYFSKITQNDWAKFIDFVINHPSLNADCEDFYSFAVQFGSMSVGQSNILNGDLSEMLPKNIKLEQFTDFCAVMNAWSDFCCNDANMDMWAVAISEYLMNNSGTDLSNFYTQVAWNIRCYVCKQKLKLKC